tara:strand:- start:503 stop:664 length:162 start_codon:yes stop_codon:yes gene_type:complete
MKLQISTLISIITAAIIFGGFYSETCSRLDSLESKVSKLETKNKNKPRRKAKK